MKKSVPIGISVISLLLSSCGNTEEPNSSGLVPEQVSDSADIPEQLDKSVVSMPVYPRLDNEKCEEFLLKYGAEHPENRVIIHTDLGDMEVELFDDTPIHRANFLYLIHRNYFNPTEILRVIKGFVIQGGNSDEEEPQTKRFLIGDYTLPSEIRPNRIHLRGALAMSRSYEKNPEKRSSSYDFYLVHGSIPGSVQIHESKQKRKYSEEQIADYLKIGGAMHLDEEHTVFGRLVKGFDVLDRIANVEVDKTDWPKNTIMLRMEIKE